MLNRRLEILLNEEILQSLDYMAVHEQRSRGFIIRKLIIQASSKLQTEQKGVGGKQVVGNDELYESC